MIERADQLVLDYVSKAADAAQGVLQPRQRIDFVTVLRRRIDAERAGTDDPVVVERVLARFGDPAALVRRELRRLGVQPRSRAAGVVAPATPLAAPTPDDPALGSDPADPDETTDFGVPAPRRPVRGHPYASTGVPSDAAEPAPGDPGPSAARVSGRRDPDDGPGGGEESVDEWEDIVEGDPPTEEIPLIREPLPREAQDARGAPAEAREAAPAAPAASETPRPKDTGPRPQLPPGVVRGMREAEELLAGRRVRGQRGWPRRRSPARSREDVAPGARDTRAILLSHRRETVGLGLLALAGLLIPIPFPPIAIFRIPVLVWAVAVLVVIACQSWHTSDKVLGMAAPIVSYTLGGGLVALVRARNDLGTVVDEFFGISGLMFLLGAAWGVFWLAYRLFDSEITPGRGGR
ncbi:hypothetical protein [Streptosporangium amethystogenes]|uniref:hypothetical protein n=1 Tax=Streptosporangium amethystogenes TaxID=2002 RepID=UPI0012FB6A12|nr:hypothetical protein [Streptosporangium amethystogenes]